MRLIINLRTHDTCFDDSLRECTIARNLLNLLNLFWKLVSLGFNSNVVVKYHMRFARTK